VSFCGSAVGSGLGVWVGVALSVGLSDGVGFGRLVWVAVGLGTTEDAAATGASLPWPSA
jgi:hypothetical protein